MHVGLWIRIHFMRIRIQYLLLNADPDTKLEQDQRLCPAYPIFYYKSKL